MNITTEFAQSDCRNDYEPKLGDLLLIRDRIGVVNQKHGQAGTFERAHIVFITGDPGLNSSVERGECVPFYGQIVITSKP